MADVYETREHQLLNYLILVIRRYKSKQLLESLKTKKH